ARFIGPKQISVGNDVLEAERIFINVGGRALVPPIAGLEHVRYLTNSSIMEIDFLPRHLVIIGGSCFGLEFAQIFFRFGSLVTVIELAPRLIAREDEDVSQAVTDILRREGVEVCVNAKCLAISPEGAGFAASIACDEGPRRIGGSHLLAAVGRRPNTDDLGLDKAGVAVDSRGFIKVDDRLSTNVPGIWALGDCNGRGA